MAPNQSKMIYTIVDGVRGRSLLVQGFNTKYGEDVRDVHYWCEDEFGNIYEPTPISPHPSGGKDYVYIKWDNQSKCMREYSEPAWENLLRVNRRADHPEVRQRIMKDIWEGGQANRPFGCHANSNALALASPCKETNYRKVIVCVGSFGYKEKAGLVEINWGQ